MSNIVASGKFAFVGRKPCGCVETLLVDSSQATNKRDRSYTANELAKMVRRGLAIERVAIERIWSKEIRLDKCQEHKA